VSNPRFRDSTSLGTQFIVLSCGVLAVVVVIGSCAFFLWEKRNMTHELADKGKTISFFISQLAEDPFLYKDVLKIDNIAAEAIKDKEVVYAFFLDRNEKPVTSLIGSVDLEDALIKGLIRHDADPTHALSSLNKSKDILLIRTPVTDGNTALGSLVLGMSRVNVHQRSSALVLYLLLFGCGIIFCLSVSIFLMFRYAAVRPIKQIIELAEKIADGDLRDTADIRGNREIIALSTAINNKHYIIRLQRHDIQGNDRYRHSLKCHIRYR